MPHAPVAARVAGARGQAIEIGWALLVLAAFGIIYIFADRAWQPLYGELSSQATHSTTTQGLQYTQTIWNALPVIAVGVSALGVLALAVYRGRVGV